MPLPVKRLHKPGSPGDARRKAGLTLTSIKRAIRQADDPAAARRDFVSRGLLDIPAK